MQVVEKRSSQTPLETEEVAQERKLVGSAVKRVEDPRLITGNDQYVDNLKFPKMVFAGLVRSPYAHARIRKIDVSKIVDNPVVVAILTPEEVLSKSNPIPVVWRVPFSKLHEHYALAQGKVKHVGDPVLAVAVRDRNALEDVLESVSVEYELLEPVLDALTAEEKPAIHDELGTNLCFAVPIATGDVDKAIKESDVVVSGSFSISRLTAAPMETRGVIADPNGLHSTLTVYSSTQWPHVLRTLLAGCLKMPENRLRVIGPDVGGAFGVKGEVFAEEVLVSLLALNCGFPVKWIESRKENFLATTHARDQTLEAQACFTKEGTLTGLKVKTVCDFGAYLHTITEGAGFITAISLNGPYRIPNFSVLAKGVYTNKVSLSAYRGFGQPEAAFTVERLMSMAARKLDMDETELRFKNLVQASDMPYKNATGGMYDSGDYAACLRKALDLAGYEDMIARRNEARRQGKLRGIGVSVFTEATGFAPGFVFAHLGLTIGGYDSATVKLDPHGMLTVTTGAFPHGQGFNTALSQICADELGLRIDDVYAFHGDTHGSPFGQGSFGSRSVAVAASAAVLAARKLAEKVILLGAYLLKVEDTKDLHLANGFVTSRSDSSKKLSIAEVAKAAYKAHDLPKGMEPALESTVYFNPVGLATSYASHISEVDVDKESGKITVLKHVSVHDCGREINPMIVEGQIHGSFAQAIGACFLEEIVYDKEGQILSGSFMDYLLPTAETIPPLITGSTSVPTPINPLGAKGIGESGTIIAPAALANAVTDAIGVDQNIIPMTPERVWKAIHKR